MSLAAQVMLNRKWLGNWAVWMAADVIYIALYASKGLWLTSVLYAVFLALCVIGLRQWRRSIKVREQGTTSSVAGETLVASSSGLPR